MAAPDRAADRHLLSVPNGHVRQGSQVHFHTSDRSVSVYQRNSQVYPPKTVVPYTAQPPEETKIYSPKVYQNANALEKYQKKEKHIVRQGKHAAAVDQLFENDLHNVRYTRPPQATDQKGLEVLPNGMAPETSTKSDQRYIRRYLNLKVHDSEPASRYSSAGVQPDTGSLHTSFDPMKDRHLWTMWRTAVNGRIVDEVRKLERIKSEKGSEASIQLDAAAPGVYGKAISVPPLKRFIKLDEQYKQAAQQLSSLGPAQLHTDQFVYYGLPRVNIAPKETPR